MKLYGKGLGIAIGMLCLFQGIVWAQTVSNVPPSASKHSV